MVRSSANKTSGPGKGGKRMAFFNAAVGVLQTLVVALGAGLGIWGAINLLEGYGNDNPGANAHVR
jgi:mafF